MSTPDLSVVMPVFEEEAVVDELGYRAASAARRTGLAFELVFVDDASGDGTAARVRSLPDEMHARLVSLPDNRGQYGATRAGLAEARGRYVVVLDGDLQDPPEVVPDLVSARRSAPDASVVFAVKTRRDDPAWFRVGRLGYVVLQRVVAGRAVPRGAGSYCLMDRALAQRVARVDLPTANLASVVVALGGRGPTVPYEKAARYDDRSRVGPVGLAAEALGSLAVLSPPGRWWLRRAGSR